MLNAQNDTSAYIESPLQQQNINTLENIKTKLGVKFSMGLHTFRGDAFDNEKLMFGFGTGMYHIIDLNKKKSVKIHYEFNLSFKGSKFSKPNDTSFSKISLSYCELPVFFDFKLNKNKKPTYLLIGGQIGFMFKNSITQGFGQYGEVKANGLPFKKFDYCHAFGFRKELGNGISTQITLKYGIVNIYSDRFNPDVNDQYKGIYPKFKDGTHSAKNISFEWAFMF